MRTRVARLAFNRGLVSRLGVARADIHRLALAAETHTNWMPRVLGSMSLRVGWGKLGETLNDSAAHFIPFVFSVTDKAIVELTDVAMRVWVSDALITRVSVSTSILNPNFTTNLANWVDADEAGGVSQWTDGSTGGNFNFSGGFMGLTGNGSAAAIRYQLITVAAQDLNVEHALHIVIANGPVTLRVGSTLGGDEYISETDLGRGVHSLALTPTGDFYIQFQSRLKRQVLVDSCNIEAAGVMTVLTPWSASVLSKIRGGPESQSGDIIFVACDGVQQQKIERRSTRSWSVVAYEPEDGPLKVANVGPNTLSPGGLSGNILINSTLPIFKSTDVGCLFRITSDGQRVTTSATGANQFTGAIRVTGVGSTRAFSIDISGVWVATITLQRSFTSSTGPWEDVTNYAANTTTNQNDLLDNQIIWYRIGIKAGNYTSGTAVLDLNYPTGSIPGIARITKFVTTTSADAEVLTDFGSINASDNWEKGEWSNTDGFPTSVAFHDGRLAWAGRDAIDMSISDAFDSFNATQVGDAGPISRSIGSGPVDTIEWTLSLQRLLMGGQGAEFSAKSSSLDEPLTPTNFHLSSSSSQGSASVAAVKIDQSAVFVQRGGVRVFELALGQYFIEYDATHLSALVPEIGSPQIIKMAVQRQPDTRLHCVRSDGTVAMLIFDKVEQVLCWLNITTDGVVEDVVVLPGDAGEAEDKVYYCVNRTINGSTKRFFEKWALESECIGGTSCKLADSFITYSQAASSTISVPHLIGEDVVVWDNGICLADSNGDVATFTVSGGGTITVTNNGAAYLATVGVVGLPYSATWKSSKPTEIIADPGGSFGDQQIIRELALVLADVHAKGLKYGKSLTPSEMNSLPTIGDTGAPVPVDTVRASYTTPSLTFPGDISNDARLCLLAEAPRPCTVVAAIATLDHG